MLGFAPLASVPLAALLVEEVVVETTGTSAGVATVTGVLEATGEFIGTAAGVGVATGVLEATGEFTGTSAGVGVATGTILSLKLTAGIADGLATVTGVLEATGEFIGTAAGVATVTGVFELQVYPWPPSLSFFAEHGSWQESPESVMGDFAVEVGPAKRRRKFYVASERLDFSRTISTSELATFIDFFDGTLKSGVFMFQADDPRTGLLTKYQFTQSPVWRDLSPGYWKLQFALRRALLPST